MDSICGFASATVGGIVAGVVVLWLAGSLAIMAFRYKRVPPNKALVASGGFNLAAAAAGPQCAVRRKGYRVVRGGGVFVMPLLETFDFLDLSPVPISWGVDGFSGDAIVRVGSTAEQTEAAVGSVLGKSVEEIGRLARPMLEGAARNVRDADGCADRVAAEESLRKAAAVDLNKLGLEIVSISVHALAPA